MTLHPSITVAYLTDILTLLQNDARGTLTAFTTALGGNSPLVVFAHQEKRARLAAAHVQVTTLLLLQLDQESIPDTLLQGFLSDALGYATCAPLSPAEEAKRMAWAEVLDILRRGRV